MVNRKNETYYSYINKNPNVCKQKILRKQIRNEPLCCGLHRANNAWQRTHCCCSYHHVYNYHLCCDNSSAMCIQIDSRGCQQRRQVNKWRPTVGGIGTRGGQANPWGDVLVTTGYLLVHCQRKGSQEKFLTSKHSNQSIPVYPRQARGPQQIHTHKVTSPTVAHYLMLFAISSQWYDNGRVLKTCLSKLKPNTGALTPTQPLWGLHCEYDSQPFLLSAELFLLSVMSGSYGLGEAQDSR